jgi:hypothetical protein
MQEKRKGNGNKAMKKDRFWGLVVFELNSVRFLDFFCNFDLKLTAMEKFRIRFPCKPYIKRYVEIIFGNPAELSKDKILYDVFRSMLRKKSLRYDQSRYKTIGKYTDEIDIKISRDDFYRYGWELSRTDIVAFNAIMEGRAKLLLYETISLYRAFNYKLTESIALFQSKYEFTEEIWSFEAIRKDCQRNLKIHKGDMEKLIAEMIKKFDFSIGLVKKI